MQKVSQAEAILGIRFQNPALLMEAITHRSFLNENRQWPYPHNERLEFLGDAVLELIVTRHLFCTFTKSPEGELTRIRSALVNGKTLSEISRKLGIEPLLLMSRGEMKNNERSRSYILANAMEALIGAIYLDRGIEKAEEFISQTILSSQDQILGKDTKDPKGLLQEKAQEVLKITPSYKVLDEAGFDHDKHFVAGVYFGTTLVATGNGSSKKEAETNAALSALTAKSWA